MAKKKQTVRVVIEYKVDGAPDESGKPTTAKLEKEVALNLVDSLNRMNYGMTFRLKSVEVDG